MSQHLENIIFPLQIHNNLIKHPVLNIRPGICRTPVLIQSTDITYPDTSLIPTLTISTSYFWGAYLFTLSKYKKGIDSLESLRQQALENGVEFIACQMSMDVMGVKQEELLDEVTIGGVATYMERADNANVNLFI